jgi:tetraacyldisaccharide 4'-kinase
VHVVAGRGRLLLDAERAGDEPALLGRCIAGLVVVGERRSAAAARAVAEGADLLLLDDGFQHRALARDFDLVLVDARRPLANGWTLPAGPLREPATGARRADAVLVVEREQRANDAAETRELPRVLRERPCYRARLVPRSLVSPEGEAWVERPLASLAGQRVLAVSGVADAESFYRMLRSWEARPVGVIEYPDHHRYRREDWRAIRDAAREADFIVTTEKDLVKLEQFPFARGGLVALRVGVEVEGAGDLLERITARIDGVAQG